MYRRGGGFSTTPPRERTVRNAHQRMVEQEMNTAKAQDKRDENRRNVRRLNERQWETVVTRLYGNPQEKESGLACAPSGSGKPKSGAEKMPSWEVQKMVSG